LEKKETKEAPGEAEKEEARAEVGISQRTPPLKDDSAPRGVKKEQKCDYAGELGTEEVKDFQGW